MLRNANLEKKIKNEVLSFFSDQCGVDINQLNECTNIIEDIGGDSLMFLQLLEGWKKEYGIDIEFRLIGKYLIKNPVDTVGKAIELALIMICEKENFLEQVGHGVI